MARRGRGEGTIRYRESDGRWEASVTLGSQRKSFYGKTRREVTEKLRTAQRDYEQGQFIGDGRQTVEQYLTSWLETKRPPEVRRSTWETYDRRIRVHVLPIIGRIKLTQLSAQHIQRVTSRGLASGRSSSTVSEAFGVLREALEDAVRLGLLAQNVADRASRPRRDTPEMHPLTGEEAQAFLDAIQTHWLSPLFTLALSTGMRQGELLALRWREVDLQAQRLSVVATMTWEEGAPLYTEPKTRRSRRQIALPPQMAERLRALQHQQRVQRLAAGAAWQGDRFDAVFSDELGFPLQSARVRGQFYRALKRAGLPHIRFHDLRHTCATLLLKQRVNPKIVSELLGHATVSITLDLYSHVLPDMQQEAAEAMSTALGW
jgi:integrase